MPPSPRPSPRPSTTGPLARPPARPSTAVVAAWVRWFGPARLAVTVIGCLAALAGLVWALQAPAPSAAGRAGPPVALDLGSDDLPVVTLVGAPTSVAEPRTVWVHVAGAVADPGVHELASDERVVAALAAAGGPLADAELDALNLAAPLADGQRIYVPAEGEVSIALYGIGGEVGGEVGGAEAGPPAPVDVNRASPTELERLPGVGPVIAAEIVADRERNGPFAGFDELVRVRGIGPAKLDALRGLVAT